MIAVVSVEIQAANVSMPLFPWRAFRNSYSSVRVRNVPRKIGKWNITNVTVQVTYPDGSIKTADAVLTGGVWVATVEGTATAGTSLQGYKILASGIDENGQPVSNYCLGRGDVTILEDDGELIPENVITYTRLLSAQPTAPKDGDLWQLSGSWYIYQDGTAYPIGDDSGLIQQLSAELSGKADISALSGCLYLYSAQPTNPKEGDVWKDISNGDYVVWQNNKTNSLGASRTWVWTTFERKNDMQNDVSSIVTEKKPSDWNYPENVNGYLYAPNIDWLNEHGDTSKTYYVLDVIWNATDDDNWLIAFTRYEWVELSEFSSWQPLQPLEDVVDAPEDTLSLPCSFDDGQGFSCSFTITRTIENALGLAMLSDLNDYELTANMQSDVSAIVLHKTPVEPAQWIWPQMIRAGGNDTYYQESLAHQDDWDKTKCYYVPDPPYFDNQYETWWVGGPAYQWEEHEDSWEVFIDISKSIEAPYDALTLTVTDPDEMYDTFTLQRVAQNTLGLAMRSDVQAVENQLSDYATIAYAVHNLSGVANITSMPLSSYESISAAADAETLYVITED